MCLAQHDVPWTFRKRWQRTIDVMNHGLYMFILYMNTYYVIIFHVFHHPDPSA